MRNGLMGIMKTVLEYATILRTQLSAFDGLKGRWKESNAKEKGIINFGLVPPRRLMFVITFLHVMFVKDTNND